MTFTIIFGKYNHLVNLKILKIRLWFFFPRQRKQTSKCNRRIKVVDGQL